MSMHMSMHMSNHMSMHMSNHMVHTCACTGLIFRLGPAKLVCLCTCLYACLYTCLYTPHASKPTVALWLRGRARVPLTCPNKHLYTFLCTFA